jgi:hypothetical protein
MNEQNRKSPTAEWPARWEPVHKDMTGPELVNVTTTDFREGGALAQEPKPPLSPFAKFIVTAARTFAGCLMFLIWSVVVGPIWLVMLMRVISSYSGATVLALFTHASPPDAKRLDAVAELWPNGYRRIIAIMTNEELPPREYIPLDPLQAFFQTLFAIMFYAGVISTVYIFVWGPSSFLKAIFPAFYTASAAPTVPPPRTQQDARYYQKPSNGEVHITPPWMEGPPLVQPYDNLGKRDR